MKEDTERLIEVLCRMMAFGVSCYAVWALGLMLLRFAEKAQLETFMLKQVLMGAGVQLP